MLSFSSRLSVGRKVLVVALVILLNIFTLSNISYGAVKSKAKATGKALAIEAIKRSEKILNSSSSEFTLLNTYNNLAGVEVDRSEFKGYKDGGFYYYTKADGKKVWVFKRDILINNISTNYDIIGRDFIISAGYDLTLPWLLVGRDATRSYTDQMRARSLVNELPFLIDFNTIKSSTFKGSRGEEIITLRSFLNSDKSSYEYKLVLKQKLLSSFTEYRVMNGAKIVSLSSSIKYSGVGGEIPLTPYIDLEKIYNDPLYISAHNRFIIDNTLQESFKLASAYAILAGREEANEVDIAKAVENFSGVRAYGLAMGEVISNGGIISSGCVYIVNHEVVYESKDCIELGFKLSDKVLL